MMVDRFFIRVVSFLFYRGGFSLKETPRRRKDHRTVVVRNLRIENVSLFESRGKDLIPSRLKTSIETYFIYYYKSPCFYPCF